MLERIHAGHVGPYVGELVGDRDPERDAGAAEVALRRAGLGHGHRAERGPGERVQADVPGREVREADTGVRAAAGCVVAGHPGELGAAGPEAERAAEAKLGPVRQAQHVEVEAGRRGSERAATVLDRDRLLLVTHGESALHVAEVHADVDADAARALRTGRPERRTGIRRRGDLAVDTKAARQ